MRYQATGAESSAFRKNAAWAAFTAVSAAVFAGPALAAGTPAGTDITNVATATYELPSGDDASVDSNVVTLKVDELLDVTVAWGDPGDVVTAPGLTGQLLSFTVTNAGTAPRLSPRHRRQWRRRRFRYGGDGIVLDTNSNGAYDAGVKPPIRAEATNPT